MSMKKKQSDGIKQQAIHILSMMKKQNEKLGDKMKKLVKTDIVTAKRVFEADVDGWTPVHACTLKGSKNLLKIMISSGIDVNFRMGQPEGLPGECSLLHIAAYRGDVKICKYLISRGARVGIQDGCDRTPLYYAQTKQHNRVVELLKQKDRGLTLTNKDQDTMMVDECPTPQPSKFCFFPQLKSWHVLCMPWIARWLNYLIIFNLFIFFVLKGNRYKSIVSYFLDLLCNMSFDINNFWHFCAGYYMNMVYVLYHTCNCKEHNFKVHCM